MNIVKSNIKYHAEGVITWTVETVSWSAKLAKSVGWGNGYIAIPLTHKFLQEIKEVIEEKEFNVTYDNMPSIDNQEWTFSKPEEIDGIKYYVFGFDTMHFEQNKDNWPESRVVSCIEAFVEKVNYIQDKNIDQLLLELYEDKTILWGHYYLLKSALDKKMSIVIENTLCRTEVSNDLHGDTYITDQSSK